MYFSSVLSILISMAHTDNQTLVQLIYEWMNEWMHLLAIDLSKFIIDFPQISGHLALCLCHGLVLLYATAPLLWYPFQ